MKNADLKNKHNHALTQWLKVGIFSLLMLAPLIASVSQWLYATFNKNAKDSYSNYTQSVLTKITDYSQITPNTTYYLSKAEPNSIGGLYVFDETNWEDTPLNCNAYRFYTNANNEYLIWYINYDLATNTYTNISNSGYSSDNFNITLHVVKFAAHDTNTSLGANVNTLIQEKGTLDNAFYYGVQKMTESDLFNWTQNTALYTGIKGMTDNLEIGTPAIAILITYWTILTIAYVIIDILITGFTWITHLIVRND